MTNVSEWTVPAPPPVPCPRCGDLENRGRITYTVWGGLVGGLIMSIRHAKCRECGTTFNKTTGERSRASMIVSVSLLSLVAVGVVALMFMS